MLLRPFSFDQHFTPEEATAVLPEAVKWLGTLRSLVLRARALTQVSTDGGEHVDAALEATREGIGDWIERFEEAGIQLQAVEPYMLDFPALYRGREVMLSWREGESQVRHWLPPHATLAARRPVDLDDAGAWEWRN